MRAVLEPRVLERVKRKRRLSSGEDGGNTTGASSSRCLSMFVQSARRQTPAGGSWDGDRWRGSGSSSRNKQRLGNSHNITEHSFVRNSMRLYTEGEYLTATREKHQFKYYVYGLVKKDGENS